MYKQKTVAIEKQQVLFPHPPQCVHACGGGALVIQHAKRRHHIIFSVASPLP